LTIICQKQNSRTNIGSIKYKIRSWKVYSEETGLTKEDIPFKPGWLNNIEAVKYVWEISKKAGFKFLRTRMLNVKDPIENLFAVIRQCGAGNIKPNCFQFIFCLKTTVLNNLSSNKSYNENCEKDEGGILDNLRDFLSQNLMLPLHKGCFFKFGVEVGVGESIESAPLV
jgi:hypothetical protein